LLLIGYYLHLDVNVPGNSGTFGVLRGRKGIHTMKIRSGFCTTALTLSIALALPAVAAVKPEALTQSMGGDGSLAIETVQIQEPIVVEEIRPPAVSPYTVPLNNEMAKTETPAQVPAPVIGDPPSTPWPSMKSQRYMQRQKFSRKSPASPKEFRRTSSPMPTASSSFPAPSKWGSFSAAVTEAASP